MSKHRAGARSKVHTFKSNCVDFWRNYFVETIEELRYGKIRAIDLKSLRPIIRDSGDKVPTASAFRREQGGEWVSALQEQVLHASNGQIAQYASYNFRAKFGDALFECPACGFGM